MSLTSSLLVIDPAGIVVGTWKRGEVLSLKKGDRIDRNSMGVPKVNGKLLNLPTEVQNKLIVHGRVKVVEA
jgi:hypothetical protein